MSISEMSNFYMIKEGREQLIPKTDADLSRNRRGIVKKGHFRVDTK